MIWGGDHTREAYGFSGVGIVSNLHCSECGADALFIEREEDDTVDDDGVCYCGWAGIDSDGCKCLGEEE